MIMENPSVENASSRFPAPRHLSTTSTPLSDHCMYYQETSAYTSLYQQNPSQHIVGRSGSSNSSSFASLLDRLNSPSPSKTFSLPDVVNSTLDQPDDLSAEKLHPSGYVGPGWKWNSFKTLNNSKRVVDCRLATLPLSEKSCYKIDRLVAISGVSPPHPGLNFDNPPDVSVASIVENVEAFQSGGLVPGDFPGFYCAAKNSGVKSFLNEENFDPRGTVLILPSEINCENFLTSEIGKMFVHVENKTQLSKVLNMGMNSLVTCASLGKFSLSNFPSINFNPRLFHINSGVHCFNPEGIKIQLILQLLYYQTRTLLTLFQRCRWIVGSDVVELDQGGNHPT